MLSTFTQVGALVGAVLVGSTAAAFARRQNRQQALGGAISRPKQIWLGLAIFDWFVLAPLLALDPSTPPALAWGLGAFAIFMALRGAAEMLMLYATKSWRPPYGIAHDGLCVLLLLAVLLLRGPALTLSSGPERWALAYYLSLIFSLLAEIGFAWAFFRVVQGRTTGLHGTWFADDRDPRFASINRATAWVNGALISFLVAFWGAGSF